jgi:hypothetical protein
MQSQFSDELVVRDVTLKLCCLLSVALLKVNIPIATKSRKPLSVGSIESCNCYAEPRQLNICCTIGITVYCSEDGEYPLLFFRRGAMTVMDVYALRTCDTILDKQSPCRSEWTAQMSLGFVDAV